MKKVKFVEVSICRGEVDVWSVDEREGKDVSGMFEGFYEGYIDEMRDSFEDEEEFEEYVEEWCICGENYFRVSDEKGMYMIEEGSKFWDIENWKEWDDEKWSEFEEFVKEVDF